MPIPDAVIDVTFRNYAELLLRHYHLLLAGKEDDPETDSVEDLLSSVWEKLNEAQRRSLNGMASDLNWVRRGGTPPPKGRRPEEVAEEDKRLLTEAEAGKNWLAVLHYLRMCAPVLETDDLAQRRAAAYAGLGLPAYAEVCRSLASTSDKTVTLGKMNGRGRGDVPDYSPGYHDLSYPTYLRWAADVSPDDQRSAFLAARQLRIADDRGRLYGIFRTKAGQIRDIGIWHQQVAVFFREEPDSEWSGHPTWPLNDEVLDRSAPPKARVPKEVLPQMEAARLITRRQRKRLARGSHA